MWKPVRPLAYHIQTAPHFWSNHVLGELILGSFWLTNHASFLVQSTEDTGTSLPDLFEAYNSPRFSTRVNRVQSKKMSANRDASNEPCQNICSLLNDFVTRRHEKVLRPLHFADMSLSQFSAELECYLSVLDSGGSIAFCRGEKLASIQLSQRLETLFQTPTPRVLDGPQLTWTTIILAVGPRFDGSSPLRVGDSLVEFAEDDLELLRSGAPWRFLNPWPDKGDCTKELQSSEMTLQEINETRQMLHQGIELSFLCSVYCARC
jgi:hypothetical protein